MINIELTPRQIEIKELVKKHEPITGDQIAEMLGVSRPTIRSDLSILVMLRILDAKPKVGYFLGTGVISASESLRKLKELKVKDVQDLAITVRETATVHDAVVMLFTENVGSLIVTNGEGTFVGLVSRRDLLKVTIGNPNAASMPVSLVMTRASNVITAHPEESIISAADKMIRHQVGGLPVVETAADGKAEAIGRITKSAMTRILLEVVRELEE